MQYLDNFMTIDGIADPDVVNRIQKASQSYATYLKRSKKHTIFTEIYYARLIAYQCYYPVEKLVILQKKNIYWHRKISKI